MKITIIGQQVIGQAPPKELGQYADLVAATYKPSRTRSSSDQTYHEDDIDPEQVVELTFDDGTVWYAQAGELPLLFGKAPLDAEHPSTDEFELEAEQLITDTEKRGLIKVVITLFRIFINGDGEQGALELAKLIEEKDKPDFGLKGVGLYLVGDLTQKFRLQKLSDLSIEFKEDRKVLLMLHGTGANTRGSYGKMLENFTTQNGGEGTSPRWTKIRNTYGNHILSFEHKSLTESPLQNLLDLLEELPQKIKTIHLLSQSRGGLVGELLVCCLYVQNFVENGAALLAAMGDKQESERLKKIGNLLANRTLDVPKFVRVCCPTNGTHLLGDRIDDALTSLFTLAKSYTPSWLDGFVQEWNELVIAMAKNRNDPKVLPGLYAMTPNSPTALLLNSAQILKENPNKNEPLTTLYVIQGNAILHKASKTRSLIWHKSRYVFQGDNDFVVDTDSMTKGLPRLESGYYLHIEDGDIQHLGYYKQDKVQKGIVEALLATPGRHPDGYKPIDYSQGAKNRFPGLPDGSLTAKNEPKGEKPIVVLLPGIMGSNLSVGDDEVWLDYLRMLAGELDRLKIDNQAVDATSLIKDAYGALYVFLTEKGYDVVPFPFDWRRRVAALGESLADKLEDLKKHKQPIHIIAHSMGGLLVKHVLAKHPDKWKDLKGQCILLGTPWRGSYLLPQVLTGHGRTINAISRLDFKHSKQQLLKVFVEYPGLLDLLPNTNPKHDFYGEKIWKAFAKTTDSDCWVLPHNQIVDRDGKLPYGIEEAGKYAKGIDSTTFDLSNIIYIAGKSSKTVSNVMLQHKFGHRLQLDDKTIAKPPKNFSLIFTATDRGDGSVTWDDGIPKGLKGLYFVDTEHGELANDTKNFKGILELLKKGTTAILDTNEPVTRGIDDVEVPLIEPLPNTGQGLVRAALGLSTAPAYAKRPNTPSTIINISFVNGHLKFASHPLMVGHFEGDAILNAEQVLDIYMGGALQDRLQLGLYPGPLGTSLVQLNDDGNGDGAIVVGLGTKEGLTQFELAKSIRMACLKYMLARYACSQKPALNQVGISSLLIGSGYGNLSMTASISAILEGITTANQEIRALGDAYPQVTELELVELYQDKAEQAFVKLDNLKQKRIFPFRVAGPIRLVEGRRNLVNLDEERDWWARLTAVERIVEGRKGIYVSANSDSSNVPERNTLVNPNKIALLMAEAIEHPNWDIQLASALFGLFVPKDFKPSFRRQQNMLWILDKTTAKYPLELMHYDTKPSEPMAVISGMIRQLATHNDSLRNASATGFGALVIGDPRLAPKGRISQLPSAAKEANEVAKLLQQNGYSPTLLVGSSSSEVLKHLFDGYRVLHVASHGVVEFGPNKDTGILLADGDENVVLTTADINQVTPVPDLVFINCCYLGRIDEAQEQYFREKYQLAANIGTQFIENGAKAVVVAGWPVDDQAAMHFARLFYEEILTGTNFGEAVRAARRGCYDLYGTANNTWGAYQCYGDPFYQLVKGEKKPNSTTKPFLLPKEATIALEVWMLKAKSNGYTSAKLRELLEDIVKNITESGMGTDDSVLENQALCYAELGEDALAIELFKALFEHEGSTYSSKAVDCYHELLGQNMVFDESGAADSPVAEIETEEEYSMATDDAAEQPTGHRQVGNKQNSFDDLISYINAQLSLGRTYTRICLLGDTYRRKAGKLKHYGDRQVALLAMASTFKEAVGKEPTPPQDAKFYAVYQWILATCAIDTNEEKSTQKTLCSKLNPIKLRLGMCVADYLQDRLQTVQERLGKQDYSRILLRILLTECRLMFLKTQKEHDEAIKQIKQDFKNLLKLSGSPRMKAEQQERLQFILEVVATDGAAYFGALYLHSLKVLKAFYNDPA